MGFAGYSKNLKLIFEQGGDLSLTGRSLLPSESYVIQMRHMLRKYNIPPWQWDIDYPEDMEGEFFPEDLETIVGIDVLENNYIRRQQEKNERHSNR